MRREADGRLQVPPRTSVLRITYAKHEQMIELSAQPPATASLPSIAESLRRLPSVDLSR
jgi:hypothetical protein